VQPIQNMTEQLIATLKEGGLGFAEMADILLKAGH
jgi:hypothetical protein